jgi:hypothetical protein
MVTPYAYTTIDGLDSGGAEIRVTIGSGGQQDVVLPCSQFSMDYGINAIPNASAMIALGRNARTGEDSPIYSKISDIKQMEPCRVELVGNLRQWSPSKLWPSLGDGVILFQGYVSGFSYRRISGRVNLVLSIVHRLHDMNCSSTGSADLVPGAPHDLLRPALVRGAGGNVFATPGGQFVTELPTDLNEDFSNGILKVLLDLAKNNQVQTGNKDLWCGASAPGDLENSANNTRVVQTIEGDGGYWKGIETFASAEYTTPCPLLVESNVKQAAADFVGEIVNSSRAGTSMWQMLISSLLPSFGAGIVPLADRALLVPILDMSQEAQKTITPNDYADFDLKAMSKRPLYGVGVMANFNYATMADGDNKRCVGQTFTAGAKDGDIPDGMWLFVNAPRWMDDWTSSDPNAVAVGGGGGGGNPDVLKLLTQPSHDAVGVETAPVDRDVDSEAEEFNDAMAKYAQMVYIANALAGRSGTVQGKLRFDIAPGMTIKVDAKGDVMGTNPGVDELAEPIYGLVARVSVFIDAEQRSAGTTIQLTNVRSETENQGGERFSMGSHPFFGNEFFKKAPLVKELDIN